MDQMNQNSFHNQQLSMTSYSQSPITRSFLNNNLNNVSMYRRNAITTVPIDFAAAQNNLSIPRDLKMNECRFFHYAPDDDNFYHITCKIILQGSILSDDDYDHGFFYSNSAANYYVTCKLISHSLIVNILNREIYGMNINNVERKGSLPLNQKFNLEQELKQILPFHIKREMRTDSNENINAYNINMTTQAVSMTDSQRNLDNVLSHKNALGGYTHNSQQVNSDSTNIWNNVTTTQAVSMTGSQDNFNNDVTHPQDYLENFSQHQIPENGTKSDYNINTAALTTNDISNLSCNDYQNVNEVGSYIPQYHIPEREAGYDRNNSLNENIENNITTTKAVSATNINQNYNDNSLSCNELGEYTYTTYAERQVDQPENVEVMTRQAVSTTDINQDYNDNGLPCNDQDVNEIGGQFTHMQQ